MEKDKDKDLFDKSAAEYRDQSDDWKEVYEEDYCIVDGSLWD